MRGTSEDDHVEVLPCKLVVDEQQQPDSELVVPAGGDHQILQLNIMAYAADYYKQWSPNKAQSTNHKKTTRGKIVKVCLVLLLVALMAAACFVLYETGSSYSAQILSRTAALLPKEYLQQNSPQPQEEEEDELLKILRVASMPNNTVIVTTINEAWAKPKSIFDLFLESFRNGNDTSALLKHVVVVALDPEAYSRCKELHPHCYFLRVEGLNFSSEAYFMTPKYLEMMWRRIELLQTILEYGYNFVFTDSDIMWFRDPFLQFYPDTDFQISCDWYNKKPFDMKNSPNGGFNFVISNNRTIEFYKFWHKSRESYPGLHDQDVLNKIKFDPFIKDIGLKMRFLDTSYFGGFCQPSKDLNKVCTMHANCCTGLDRKIHDLNLLLEDWKTFKALPTSEQLSKPFRWRAPKTCKISLKS